MNSKYTDNRDHHIWNNNGTWWAHFTVHHPDHTKERVRVSLHTKDVDEARRRRDFIMRGTAAIVPTIPRSRALNAPISLVCDRSAVGPRTRDSVLSAV